MTRIASRENLKEMKGMSSDVMVVKGKGDKGKGDKGKGDRSILDALLNMIGSTAGLD